MPRKSRLSIIVSLVLLLGCATELPRQSAELHRDGFQARTLVLKNDLVVAPDSGFRQKLKANSEWVAVGSLEQGTVFRPTNTVLTIGGGNHHEAWLVVKADRLTGFYLPGEKAFAPLSKEVFIPRE
jgi:hypothetical protein